MSTKQKTPKEKKAERRRRIDAELEEKRAATVQEAGTFSKPSSADLDVTTPVRFIQAQPDDADLRLPNQVYMVLSYVAPADDKSKCRTGAKNVMIKVSGVFGNEEETSKYARKIHGQVHHRDLIDSFVVPIGQWLTIPMPHAAEMYTHKIYAEQPVIDKLMHGHWQATENSRKEVALRVARSKAANEKKLKAIYGEDYKSPTRDPAEVAREKEAMEKQAPPATEQEKADEKSYTLVDIYMMFAKYIMKKAESSVPGCSADAPAPGRFDIKKLTPEMREQIKDFKVFVEEEVKMLESQAKSLSESATGDKKDE